MWSLSLADNFHANLIFIRQLLDLDVGTVTIPDSELVYIHSSSVLPSVLLCERFFDNPCMELFYSISVTHPK